MKELTLLFLLRGDQVLLAMKKRGFGEGKWNGVGGKLESNETIEQALIRECQEEINVLITAYERVGEITFNEFHEGTQKILNVHVFTAAQWQGEPIETDEMAPRWFNIVELPLDKMWPDDEFWLPQVLAGKKIRGTFTLDANETITDQKVTEVVTL